MKVSIMSRSAIESLLKQGLPTNTAVISFYDPKSRSTPIDYLPVDFHDKYEHILMAGVHDIDIEILKDYGLTYETYLPEANEMAKFVLETEKAGWDVICQFEYGQSRSAACAAAIL